MSKAEIIDGKWVRIDGKECYCCQNTNSTSSELFEVEYMNGEKLLYCTVCIGEGPFDNEAEEIKIIRRVI